MAIRFQCQECHHLLSIASRKAGSVIECPICAAIQVVPDEETAQAALEQAALSLPPPETPEDLAGEDDRLMVLDDLEELAGSGPPLIAPSLTPPSQEPSVLPPAETPPAKPLPPESPGPEAPSPDASEWILFRRKTIYIQGILFVVVAVVSLTLGLVIGRLSTYVAPVNGAGVAGEEQEQVFVEGRLVYDPGKGTLVGDEDAVIVILPHDKTPAEPLPIRGLRPQDPTPSEAHRELRSLQEFGGIYLRANAEGNFHAVLPRAGKYHLLLISRHASRPEEDLIDEVDREEIGRYFRRGEDLVGRSKYRWTLETFRPGAAPVKYGFGLDGQE
ncbi:MAG: hypothetical protein ABFD16_20625 [Thermoguttaceae bacterium]|jgi:hypothetical protein